MNGFILGTTVVVSTLFFDSSASATSGIIQAGTTGQSVMQSLSVKQKKATNQQLESQPKPRQSSVLLKTTSVEANQQVRCRLRSITAGGQAKNELAAVQACSTPDQ